MDKYDPQKRVGLIVDEWGTWHAVEPGTNPGFLYQQNTLRDALVAGLTLNIFNQHCDRVRMANIAQTINVLQAMILTDKEKMLLTPTYHVFEMYTVHHDATLLPTELKCADYQFGAGQDPGAERLRLAGQGGQDPRLALQPQPERAGGSDLRPARRQAESDLRPRPDRREPCTRTTPSSSPTRSSRPSSTLRS